MQSETNYNNFLRFLKDEKFIEWKLLPTDELDTFWKKYLLEHPDENADLLRADKHLQKINFSPFKIPPEKKQEAILRLKQSLNVYNRKRSLRRFVYIATACVAALLHSFFYTQKEVNRSGLEMAATAGYIVGSKLIYIFKEL